MSQNAPLGYAPPPPSNGLGTAGFIVSLVGLFTGGILSPLGLLLSFIALFRRPRGMATAGFIIGMIGSIFLAAWLAFFGFLGFTCFNYGSTVVATMTAPSHATHDFLAALARGDDVEAKKHSALSDADFASAKAMVQAQGDFIDTNFNNISINEGDTGKGHVEGTAQFKTRTLNVKADLSDGPEGWRVTSIELLP